MMNEPNPPSGPALPPRGDEKSERCEAVLAYLLDALEDEERQVVRERLKNDPAWQQAERDARAMLSEMQSQEAAREIEPPIHLAGKTIRGLREQKRQQSLLRLRWLEITPRVAVAVFLIACLPLAWMLARRTWTGTDPVSIRWTAEPQLVAGASFAPRLEVRGAQHARPAGDILIQAALVSSTDATRYEIGEARTGADGLPAAGSKGGGRTLSWNVPEVPPGTYELQVNAYTPGGQRVDSAKRSVTVIAPVRLALAPDRLWVRPGETLRVRALMAAAHNQKPLPNETISLDLFDPQGNRLGHFERKTSLYGLAWGEFPLDEEAPSGTYLVKAECAGLKAERRIQVREYQRPPFRVLLRPARPWYQPEMAIEGVVSAITFDGHPIAAAKGELCLRDTAGQVVARQTVELDGEGRTGFSLLIPADQRPPSPVRWSLDAQLSDGAGRQASGQADLPLSPRDICIQAIPEAGELVQSLTNRVYLIAWRPDGTPCANLPVEVLRYKAGNSEPLHAGRTDTRGVMAFELAEPVAPSEVIEVWGGGDGAGALPAQRLALAVRSAVHNPDKPSGCLLIRPARAIVTTPDALKFDVFARDDAPVALAVRQGDRTLAIASVDVTDGHGQGTILLPEELLGVFTLEAWQKATPGKEWHDRRVLFAAGSAKLKVTAGTDRARYKPGETARVSFLVCDEQGRGRPAALSVTGIDEALLHLTGGQVSLTGGILCRKDEPVETSGLPFGPTMLMPGDNDALAAAACMAAVPAPVEAAPTGLTLERLLAKGYINDARILDDFRRCLLNPMTPQDQAQRDYIIEYLKQTGMWEYVAPLIEGGSEGSIVIDTAPGKQSQEHQAKVAFDRRVTFWTCLLICLLLVLICLALSMSREATGLHAMQLAKYMVAGITFVLWLCGMVIFNWLLKTQDARWLLVALGAILVIAHVLLLARASVIHWTLERSWKQSDLSPDRLTLGTVVLDGILLLLVFAVCGSTRSHGEAVVLLAVGGFVAGVVQLCLASPSSEGGTRTVEIVAVLAVLMLLGGLLLPVLSSARSNSRERAALNSARSVAMAAEMARKAENTPHPIVSGTEITEPGPRVRRDFRETLVFQPQLITNEDGTAQLEIPLADSLTAWELQADAIAQSGGLGMTRCRFEVTQPFSVDLSLPTDVTEGDLLFVPAVVSNHGDEAREVDVRLNVDGAECTETAVQRVTVAPKSVAAVEFPVRFGEADAARLRVTASAGALADAAERWLKVRPNARPVAFGASAFVGQEGLLNVMVPATARPVTAQLTIHRTPLTQLEEGLESMLREPHGCFEQTSSTSYPNAMILGYLRAHSVSKPEVEARAKDLLARGYQRLLTFEVGGKSGSFSLYGHAPASTWLTAYGLMQFNDLAEVYPVDPALLERMRRWLTSQVQTDGSFRSDADCHADVGGPSGAWAATAYAVWALGVSAPSRSVEYLKMHADQIERDPYLCALTANAVLHHDRGLATQLARALRSLVRDEEKPGRRVACLPCAQTLAWGRGDIATTEATALGALALLETGEHPELAGALLAGIQERGHGGMWGSTHATIFCLKALARAASAAGAGDPVRVVVRCNGEVLPPIEVPGEKEARRVSQRIPLNAGENRIGIKTGGGAVVVRVSGEAMVPWSVQDKAPAAGVLRTSATWDRNGLFRNESVMGTLRVVAAGRRAEVPMLVWGLPAGFRPVAEDLDKLKTDGRLMRWEISGRYLRLYLPDVGDGEEKVFIIRFIASARGAFTSPAGKAYEYYRPDEACCLPALKFTVQ